ncbi:MAG TPA: hypothetical protein VEV84_08725, partial [Pyrinomonadaceae bacterium]|nr:hypothetical protein [Pyrinomonadaceae bacterium]
MTDLARNVAGGFVEVALPLPLRHTFTYQIKAAEAQRVKIGSRVLVPLGKRLLTGYVLDISERLPAESDIDKSKLKN